MKTIRDVFSAFKHGLQTIYNANESEAVTLLAVSEISGLSKAKIKAFSERELTQQQFEKLTGILEELKTGRPIQYILGETEFYGLTFRANPSVLIPRPETEELVEWALLSVSSSSQLTVGSRQLAAGHILDIGTGSGCIAISLKKHLPDAKVSAIDISSEALKTAKENAKLNEVAIEFIEADILNQSSLSHISNLKSQISIILSNPPYVTLHDKTQMHQNVTGFEPHTALFVPENDPLLFYKAIADFAVDHLTNNGLLFFEINESYGQQVAELLADKGFKNIELRKDLSGRDRMIKAML
ncbi:MAG TPA: peptide chain release factor N(5)-glutamine methyltransferase [Mucilaginibacter sp.]|nr:peptide chain release factor N(5)-glutamine methyltransferase [Mucilaginibacter sp.]